MSTYMQRMRNNNLEIRIAGSSDLVARDYPLYKYKHFNIYLPTLSESN